MELLSRDQSQGVPKATYSSVTPRDVEIVIWTLTAISAVFLATRLFIRYRAFRKLGWDDALIILAWSLLLTAASLWQSNIEFVRWQYAVQIGEEELTPAFEKAFVTFLHRTAVAESLFFYCCLWSVKYNFLVFFRQFELKSGAQQMWWWIVFGVTSAGLIVAIATINFGCYLSSADYILAKCESRSFVANFRGVIYGNMTVDILTDLLILSIPWIILWRVQISTKHKLILCGLFSLTVLIMAVAVVRAVFTVPKFDEAENPAWTHLWALAEMGVAIMIGCTASFRQLFVGKARQRRGSSSKLDGLWTPMHDQRQYLQRLKTPTKPYLGSLQVGWSAEVAPTISAPEPERHHLPLNTRESGSIYVHSTVDVASEELPPQSESSYQRRQNDRPVEEV